MLTPERDGALRTVSERETASPNLDESRWRSPETPEWVNSHLPVDNLLTTTKGGPNVIE